MDRRQSTPPIEGIEDAGSVAANRAIKSEARKKAAIAREILTDNAVPTAVVEKDNQAFGREAQLVTSIFSVLVAAMLITWYFWEDRFWQNEDDFIYNLGLVGGIMMLLQFVYSARKRSAKMRRWGVLKEWFNVHMFIGLVAPVIIILHSRFELLSINGTVAFFAMLMVVFSGIVGRYLYSQVNFDLTAGRKSIKSLHMDLHEKVLAPYGQHVAGMETDLKAFMLMAFATPPGLMKAFIQALSVGIKAHLLFFRLSQTKIPQMAAVNSGAVNANLGGFSDEEKTALKKYLKLLASLARYSAYKRLFSLWRIGHVPVIYLLLVTGSAHVLAVHMY